MNVKFRFSSSRIKSKWLEFFTRKLNKHTHLYKHTRNGWQFERKPRIWNLGKVYFLLVIEVLKSMQFVFYCQYALKIHDRWTHTVSAVNFKWIRDKDKKKITHKMPRWINDVWYDMSIDLLSELSLQKSRAQFDDVFFSLMTWLRSILWRE